MDDSLDAIDSIELSDESITLDSSEESASLDSEEESDSVDSSKETIEDSLSLVSSLEMIEIDVDSFDVETRGSELEVALLTLEMPVSLCEETGSEVPLME